MSLERRNRTAFRRIASAFEVRRCKMIKNSFVKKFSEQDCDEELLSAKFSDYSQLADYSVAPSDLPPSMRTSLCILVFE